MSADKDGLSFSDIEPEVPASLWVDSQLMTLADLAAAYERLRDSPPTWRERPVALVSPQEARAIESTLQAMATRINGSPVLTIPIGERVDGSADFAEEPDQQMFTAIESTFATTLPRLELLWIRDGVSMVGEPMKIDTSAEPESTNERWSRWVKGRITSAITVASLLRYPADSDDYLRHTEDYLRTRVRPGANPREEWAEGEAPSDSRSFLGHDDAGYSAKRRAQVRKFPRGQRRAASRRGAARWSTFEMPVGRGPMWTVCDYESDLMDMTGWDYVPCDVCRWRDPAHRAELTRRARGYADCAQRLVDR